jgi:gamma-glutamyltranspeptidase/glutathione hydrolase/leukotriene-C4 hydrolase
LFEPTIDMCENGFRVSGALSRALESKENLIKQNERLSSYFINPITNRVYKKNDIVKMPHLATTLRIISEKGVDAFYKGELTKSLVQDINESGGNVTEQDFALYQTRYFKDRLVIRLDNDLRVFVPPPPSSGILVPFIMKVMRGFNMNSTHLNSSMFYHRLLETFKHAYAKRTRLGDEDFVDVKKIIEDCNNDSHISYIRSRIDDEVTFPPSYYGADVNNLSEDHGTGIF